jgi:hypothetical protein
MAGFCGHGNELYDFIKVDFLDELSECQLLKKSASRSVSLRPGECQNSTFK